MGLFKEKIHSNRISVITILYTSPSAYVLKQIGRVFVKRKEHHLFSESMTAMTFRVELISSGLTVLHTVSKLLLPVLYRVASKYDKHCNGVIQVFYPLMGSTHTEYVCCLWSCMECGSLIYSTYLCQKSMVVLPLARVALSTDSVKDLFAWDKHQFAVNQ